jgi:hypothetical protein
LVFENEFLHGIWVCRHVSILKIHASTREVSLQSVARRSTRLGENDDCFTFTHTSYETIPHSQTAQKISDDLVIWCDLQTVEFRILEQKRS